MHARTLTRVIAAVAVIGTGALVLLARGPSGEPVPVVQHDEGAQEPVDAPFELAVAAPPAPSDEELVAAKVQELEAMSETFRNTTFLIAIRDTGFTCNELLRVYGGVDGAAKWLATCSEMLAYTVSVASTGTLHVEPFLQYFDGLTPRVIDRDFDAPSQPAPQPR